MINYAIIFIKNLILNACITKCKLLCINITYIFNIKYLLSLFIYRTLRTRALISELQISDKYVRYFENQFMLIMVMQLFISPVILNVSWHINFPGNRNSCILFFIEIVKSLYWNAFSLVISNNFLRLSRRCRLRGDDAATQSSFLPTMFRWAEKSMIQIEITNGFRRGPLGRSIRA